MHHLLLASNDSADVFHFLRRNWTYRFSDVDCLKVIENEAFKLLLPQMCCFHLAERWWGFFAIKYLVDWVYKPLISWGYGIFNSNVRGSSDSFILLCSRISTVILSVQFLIKDELG